jgi:single-stranded DNA-binding protein
VEVIADTVQFLGGRSDSVGEPANQFVPAGAANSADADFGGSDDDIPF